MPQPQESERTEDNNHQFPIKYLLIMWLSFISIVSTTLILLTRSAFSEGARYLYNVDGDGSESFPIVDYLPPDNETLAEEGGDYAYMHPDFLYKPDNMPDYDPPPRVVEFYAPWCPHCKHFKPRFIEMAKEIHAKQPKIAFHAVSCVAHHKLCKTQNVDGYPTVMLYKEGSYMAVEEEFDRANADSILEKLGFDSEGKQTSTGKVKSIRVKPPVKRHVTLKPKGATNKSLRNEEVHKEKPKPVESKPAKIARVVPFHTHEVSDAWHDAATSFEFSLKYNIYMSNGHMPRKQQDAFLDWLELLVDVLPPQMNRTLDLIKHLIDNFTRATLGLEIMNELIREKFPPMKEQIWKTCTYEDNDNGYTCGLWQLFHVMSVGLVEHNKHSKSPIPTRYVAETLRNYIENFFQCDVCRMNFLYMYDSCAFDGCHRLSNQASTSEHDWKEFPLWLWETHNDVNVRLMGERLQRDNQEGPSDWEQQQARWPSLYQCPNCWREDHSWDQDEVFEELHSVYWVGNPTHIKIQSTDRILKMEDDAQQSRGAPRSWKIVGVIFSIILLLVWVAKSKRLLKLKASRREKKY